MATLTGHTDTVEDLAFSPDGKPLATTASVTKGDEEPVRMRDVDAGRLAAAACAKETNRLTKAERKAVLPKIFYKPPCS